MKRLLGLLALATICASALGQTTTYTGTIRDLTGAAVTSGRITFTLKPSGVSNISGTGSFVSTAVSCLIDASGHPVASSDGVSACTVSSNTALTPTGTYYNICIQPQYVSPGSCLNAFALGGSVDITTLVPTPATQPSYGVGTAGGIAPLDTSAKVPLANLPYSGLASDGNNGIIVAGAVSAKSVSGVLDATQYTGSDIGAKVNAAFAACSTSCTVRIPAGSYTFSTPIVMTSASESLVGDGPLTTRLTCTSSTDCIDVYPVYGNSLGAAGMVANIGITGNGGGSQQLIHTRDIIGLLFQNLQLDNAGSVCMNLEDYAYWTERNVFDHINFGYNCKTALKFSVNAINTNGQASFGYNHFRSLGFNPNGAQTAVAMTGWGVLYNGSFEATMNFGTLSTSLIPIGFTLTNGTDATGSGAFAIKAESFKVGFEANQTIISGTYYSRLWNLTDAANVVLIYGNVSGDPIPSNFAGTGQINFVTAGGGGVDYSSSSFVNVDGIPFDYHANGAFLIPSTSGNGFFNGFGLNCRFSVQSVAWKCTGDGAHNGGSLLLGDSATGNLDVLSYPSTSGATQTVTIASPIFHITPTSVAVNKHTVFGTYSSLTALAGSTTAAQILDDAGVDRGDIGAVNATSSPVGSWPLAAFILEGTTSGGTVLGSVGGPILFQTNNRTLRAVISSTGAFGVGSSSTPASDPFNVDTSGNVTVAAGGNTVLRCTTAGTLPIGALTTVAGNCGASVDTGLRVH